MPNALFNDNPPACEYCARGVPAATGNVILCYHKGVCRLSDSCRRFKYDPLKRAPDSKTMPALPEFSPEDFEI